MKTFTPLLWITALAALVAGATVPNHVSAQRIAGNEALAIGTIQLMSTAQSAFREGDLDGDGVYDYANSVQELVVAGLVTPQQLKGHGYQYGLRHGSAPKFLWMAVAFPKQPGVSGGRCFATNQAGVVYVTPGPLAFNPSCTIPIPPCPGGCPPPGSLERCQHAPIGR